MYMETSIIRNNKIIADFEFTPNEELSLHLRAHNRVHGGDDWFDISKLTEDEVKAIKNLCNTQIERDFFKDLQEGDSIDILLHFCIYVKN